MPSKNRTCSQCPNAVYSNNRTGLCRPCLNARQSHHYGTPSLAGTPAEVISFDRQRTHLQTQVKEYRKKYEDALQTIQGLENSLAISDALRRGSEPFVIEPKPVAAKTNEGTVVLIASDWHVEENVGPEVGGLNRYNLEIAQDRATQFFQAGLRLTNLLGQDIRIHNVVVALLGDFITNDIHSELNDLTEVLPVHALVKAQNFIISGIEFLLANSDYQFTFVCHSGNHARTTKQTHFAAENGHSLEYLMYLMLAGWYRNNPRVTFVIPDGYHSYVQIYNQMIRFHHGHAVKYQGGVGGIYIPVNKAIAQWNKARQANLDVFGHFHQFRDGGNFICNGSMIGYNGFALSIKADFEVPKQGLFLIDKKRGRTATWPIYFKDALQPTLVDAVNAA